MCNDLNVPGDLNTLNVVCVNTEIVVYCYDLLQNLDIAEDLEIGNKAIILYRINMK